MPTPIKSQIASSLRAQILAGKLPEGARIKEDALAKQFGVSRGPIRDVFLELSKEGLLEATPNRGASVSQRPSAAAREIFINTRRAIETLALETGFPYWTEDDLNRLEKILRYHQAAAKSEDLTEVIEHDMAFHRFIVDRDPSRTLKVVWLPLMTTIALPYTRHTHLLESYEEHLKIVGHLKKGHLKRAANALKKHIQ